jgi:hypothetical protein
MSFFSLSDKHISDVNMKPISIETGPELGKLSPGATSGKANILHTCPRYSYMIHASC